MRNECAPNGLLLVTIAPRGGGLGALKRTLPLAYGDTLKDTYGVRQNDSTFGMMQSSPILCTISLRSESILISVRA